MDEEILTKIKTRNILYRKSRKNNCSITEKLYQRTRNEVVSLIRSKKEFLNKTKVQNSLGDAKNMWRTTKEIAGLPTGKTAVYPPTIKTEEGETNDEQEIAELFNKFFVAVGPTLAQDLDASKFKNTVEAREDSMYLSEITPQQVTNYIGQLHENKSTRPGDISPRTLKCLAEVVAEPICHIFNQSLNSGVCPDAFKIAHVVPVYKQGDRKILTNYRPISLISALAKVYEKCLSVRLLKYLEKIDFFSGSQFGFRKNKSTLDALHELTSFIRNCLDGSKKMCWCLFGPKKGL